MNQETKLSANILADVKNCKTQPKMCTEILRLILLWADPDDSAEVLQDDVRRGDRGVQKYAVRNGDGDGLQRGHGQV